MFKQIDLLCPRSDIDILMSNAHRALCINSAELARVLFIAIRATDDGSVKINDELWTPDSGTQNRDEVDLFQFGDSSNIIAFEIWSHQM